MQNANLEQEIIDLSKEKWGWMSESQCSHPGRTLP